MRTKQQAEAQAAKALAKMRNPKTWKVRVHENLGWHWNLNAANGQICVAPGYDGNTDFFCMISRPGSPGGGNPEWTPCPGKRFSDPQSAVDSALVDFNRHIIALHLYQMEILQSLT